jgi:hypothetical protein
MGCFSGVEQTWASQLDVGRTHIATKGTVQSGLVLNLDAGASSSYSGSGTTWSDLSGNGNNGTLVNGPTYNSSNGGSLVFNGSSQYIDIGTFFNYQSFTLNLWVRAGSSQVAYADIFDNNHSGTQNFVLQQNASSTNNYEFYSIDASGIISTVSLTLTPNIWTNLTFTFTPSDRVIAYINGLFGSQGALAGGRNIAYSAQYLRLATHGGGIGRAWNGIISNFSAYNRVLSAAEVSQNFQALRGRYGI